MKNIVLASTLVASLGAFALPAAADQAGNGSFTSSQTSGYVDLTNSPFAGEVIVDIASVSQGYGYTGGSAKSASNGQTSGSFTSSNDGGYADLSGTPVTDALIAQSAAVTYGVGGSFTSTQGR